MSASVVVYVLLWLRWPQYLLRRHIGRLFCIYKPHRRGATLAYSLLRNLISTLLLTSFCSPGGNLEESSGSSAAQCIRVTDCVGILNLISWQKELHRCKMLQVHNNCLKTVLSNGPHSLPCRRFPATWVSACQHDNVLYQHGYHLHLYTVSTVMMSALHVLLDFSLPETLRRWRAELMGGLKPEGFVTLNTFKLVLLFSYSWFLTFLLCCKLWMDRVRDENNKILCINSSEKFEYVHINTLITVPDEIVFKCYKTQRMQM